MATKIPKSIYEKKMNDGSTHIMVRFTHDCITYPVKNFTKLFGCKTREDANIELGKVKDLLRKGQDPFIKSLNTFAELYEDLLNTNEASGEWAYNTVKNRRNFFNRYIKNDKRIGKKRVENITYMDIKTFLSQFKNSFSSRNTSIDILRAIFKSEYNKEIIHKNLMENKEFKKKRFATRLEIKHRTKTNQAEIARGLYESIKYYSVEQARPQNVEIHKAYLYMLIMTAHRYDEVLNLRKEHCDLEEMKIKAPESITKSKDKEGYEYPIPDELYDYINNHEGGLLFPTPRGGNSDKVFKKLVDLAEVKLAENHQISSHDTRRLFLNILIEELEVDSNIADWCLEHKKSDVMSHYLQLNWKTKVKTFKKYWEFLRGNSNSEVEINKSVSVDNETSFQKLDKLVGMLEKGYISQEQFEFEKNKLYS